MPLDLPPPPLGEGWGGARVAQPIGSRQWVACGHGGDPARIASRLAPTKCGDEAGVVVRWPHACPHPGPPPEGEGGNRSPTHIEMEYLKNLLTCPLPPWGRVGVGACVRKHFCHAMPSPRPSPRGGGSNSGSVAYNKELSLRNECLAPSPLGEGWGGGTREATVRPRDAPTSALPEKAKKFKRQKTAKPCRCPKPQLNEDAPLPRYSPPAA